jgi:hypothetical protein
VNTEICPVEKMLPICIYECFQNRKPYNFKPDTGSKISNWYGSGIPLIYTMHAFPTFVA